MGKILVLDNYDSFTYNLVHSIKKFSSDEIDVFRNDKISIEDVEKYDRIILSPGPGIPDEAGILKELIRIYAPKKNIFGVCLGMQAITEVFGGKLVNLSNVYHGIATNVEIKDINEPLFKGLPNQFNAGRYHSWAASKVDFPECLKITCNDMEGTIMALAHKSFNVRGVQFHPESVLTEYGDQIIKNWLEMNNF